MYSSLFFRTISPISFKNNYIFFSLRSQARLSAPFLNGNQPQTMSNLPRSLRFIKYQTESQTHIKYFKLQKYIIYTLLVGRFGFTMSACIYMLHVLQCSPFQEITFLYYPFLMITKQFCNKYPLTNDYFSGIKTFSSI